MKNQVEHRPLLPLVLLSLTFLIVSINGFIGGYLMLSDPNGAPMGMPVSDLARTPFQNYTIPGIFLIMLWGFGSMIALMALWFRPQIPLFNRLMVRWTHEHWAWTFSVLMGIALLIWLTVQIFTLPAVAPIQIILYVLAFLMVGLPFIPQMRDYYHL
jgi:hypothetical protein